MSSWDSYVYVRLTSCSHPAFSNIRTTRAPSGRAPDSTDDTALNLGIRRQAVMNAILVIQMLNPDHTVAPLNSRRDEPKVAINEVRSWGAFANHSGGWQTTFNGRVFPSVSVESFHDGIHGLIGTGDGSSGHMGNPQVAAVSLLIILRLNTG